MTSMILTAQEFPVPMGMEFSPKALHGLSHREVGDYSEAMSMIFEVAEPMLDRIRGITDEKLLMEGRDEFVVKAGEHKLLYAPMDDKGWPIDVRVGRHLSALLQTIDSYNMTAPDKPLILSGVPRYAEVIEKTTGAFLRDPSAAPADPRAPAPRNAAPAAVLANSHVASFLNGAPARRARAPRPCAAAAGTN